MLQLLENNSKLALCIKIIMNELSVDDADIQKAIWNDMNYDPN